MKKEKVLLKHCILFTPPHSFGILFYISNFCTDRYDVKQSNPDLKYKTLMNVDIFLFSFLGTLYISKYLP